MTNETSIFDFLFIDIETVPQYADFSELDPVWKTLWIDKISKTVPENTTPEESYLQKAGILAEFGKVVCISTAYLFETDNKEIAIKIKSIYGDDEKKLLHEFIQLADKVFRHNKKFEFAGHNIREFDIPYLCRRMLINQIPLPEYLNLHGAKPWEIRITDTLQWWKFGDYKNFISLNLLAHILNIPTSKTDIDGSKVQHVYYHEKDLRRIADYCQRDVIVVANIILYFKNLPLLQESNTVIVQ